MATPSSFSSIPPLPNSQALSSITFKKPVLDGSMTLPEIYDWHYINSPNHPLFVYSDDLDNVQTIVFYEAVRAIHKVARLVRSQLPVEFRKSGRPTVAILSSSGNQILSVLRAYTET